MRRWPSGRVLTYRVQGHGLNPWPSHYLKTVKVGILVASLLSIQHLRVGSREGKWCKNQG